MDNDNDNEGNGNDSNDNDNDGNDSDGTDNHDNDNDGNDNGNDFVGFGHLSHENNNIVYVSNPFKEKTNHSKWHVYTSVNNGDKFQLLIN